MNMTHAISMIENAERILITTHVRPDADAIGSVVALQQMLDGSPKRKGADGACQILLLGEPGQSYRFLLQQPFWLLDRDIRAQDIENNRLDEFDLIIVLDTCSVNQLPGVGEYLLGRDHGVMVIDHHISGDRIGQCRLIDAETCAAGEIIFQLARQAGWRLNHSVASALFVAIAADTGWFRFENASARAYAVAAQLVEAGAQPDRLYHLLYENFPPQRARLLAAALAGIELHCDGRFAVMQITCDMLRRTGAQRSHIENIVNECHQIGSVIAAVLLVEQDDGTTRCSLRSRADIDVNAIARQFGGGGHARAAGATLAEPLGQATEKLIAAFTAAMPA